MVCLDLVSGLVNNFNTGIFSDTINVKLCMTALITELYLFIPLSVALPYLSVKQF